MRRIIVKNINKPVTYIGSRFNLKYIPSKHIFTAF